MIARRNCRGSILRVSLTFYHLACGIIFASMELDCAETRIVHVTRSGTHKFAADCCCCICLQTPVDVPWANFDAQNPTVPVEPWCWQCLDTCTQRWPWGDKDAWKEKAKDERFRGQVMAMSKVKLGIAAKNFFPQEVEDKEMCGLRFEEELDPYTAETFQERFQATPSEAPSTPKTTLTDGRAQLQQWYLVRDPKKPPKVTLWHEHQLSLSEIKSARDKALSANQGTEVFKGLLAGFLKKAMDSNVEVPTVAEINQQIRQSRCSGSVSAGPGAAAASSSTSVVAAGVGGAAALLALETAAANVSPQAPPGAKRRRTTAADAKSVASVGAGTATAVPPATPKGRGKSRGAGSGAGNRAAEVPLPTVEDYVLGEAGRDGKTQLQILYICKQQMDGKYQRGEMSQEEYVTACQGHRVRMYATGLAPGHIEKASASETDNCMVQLTSEWNGALPIRAHYVFFKKLELVFSEMASAGSSDTSSSGASKPAAVTDSSKSFPLQLALDSTHPLEEASGIVTGQGPRYLKHVPAKRLSQEGRWEVCKQLCLEFWLPRYLHEFPVKPGDAAFQTYSLKMMSLASGASAGAGSKPDGQIAVYECFALLACPWQETPMTTEQLKLMQLVALPEGVAPHIRILASLLNLDWKMAMRTAMGFSMKEVGAQPEIERIKLMFEKADQIAQAMTALMPSWMTWKNELRPMALRDVSAAAHKAVSEHMQAVATGVSKLGGVEHNDIVNFATFMATHAAQQDSDSWTRLQAQAQEQQLQVTAEARWQTCREAVMKLQDEINAGNVVPLAEAAEACCQDCQNLPCPAEDTTLFVEAARNALAADAPPEEQGVILRVGAVFLALVPKEIQPELRKVANTAREAAGLLLLLQEEAPDINSSDASGFAASKSTSESLSAWLARAKSQLKAYNAALAAIGDTPHEEMTAYVTIWPQVQEAAQNIQKRQQEFGLRLVQTSRNRAHTAVTTLQQSVAGLNWKARLAEGEASWSAIVKEIEYTFWKAKESPIGAMEAQYAQATEAVKAYTDDCTNNEVTTEKALKDLWRPRRRQRSSTRRNTSAASSRKAETAPRGN